MSASTATAPGVDPSDGADDLEAAVGLLSGRFERLRADALGQLGRLQAGHVDDEELADLIEQADVTGLRDNMRWDPRVLIQLRALRIVLHQPPLPALQEICANLVDPGYVRRRLLAEMQSTGVFEGLAVELRQRLEAWPEAQGPQGVDWRAIAATFGAILNDRFANRRAAAVTRARPNAIVRRVAPSAADPVAGKPAAMDPAYWSRQDVRGVRVVQRLSPIAAHLLHQLAAKDQSGVAGTGPRRVLVQLACLDGWLRPDRALVNPDWIDRLRAAEQLVGRTATESWTAAMRGTVRVKFSSATPVVAGVPAAALTILLWRHRILDESVISQLLGLVAAAPRRERGGVPHCVNWCESDRSALRHQDPIPAWVIEAADRALATGRLPGIGRAATIAEALGQLPRSRMSLETRFGPRAAERLAAAFLHLRTAPSDHFLNGRVELVLAQEATQRYGGGLRAALERAILVEAAAAGLFTLTDGTSTAAATVVAGRAAADELAYRRLEALSGKRTAMLIRQAVAAAGANARISIAPAGAVHLAVGS